MTHMDELIHCQIIYIYIYIYCVSLSMISHYKKIYQPIGLVWFGFMAYQPLLVIYSKILFIHMYETWFDSYEEVLHISQITEIGSSLLDGSMSYPRHLLVRVFFTSLQRCSLFILQPHPIGFYLSVWSNFSYLILISIFSYLFNFSCF